MIEQRKKGNLTHTDIKRQALTAAEAASSKKGHDIVVLDVGTIISITDFFVIVSGSNDRQVRTIVEEVERQVAEEHGVRPLRIEGRDDAHWVLMDFGDFFVHVFHEETRSYYELERLWSDAPRVAFSDVPSGFADDLPDAGTAT